MPDKRKSRKAFEFGTLTGLAYLVVSFCALSWGKDFLLPIVLAILISFLLTPAVTRLEQFGLHPGLAILGPVAIAFALVGAVLATVTVQAVDLTNSLPKYRDNIEAKWVAIQKGPPGPVNLAFRNVGELVNDLGKITASAGGGQQPQPVKVEVVSGGARLVSLVRAGMTPIVGPVGEFAVVVVLMVFMLIERKRLRQRFLGLVGPSRLATTTLAIDRKRSSTIYGACSSFPKRTAAFRVKRRVHADLYMNRPGSPQTKRAPVLQWPSVPLGERRSRRRSRCECKHGLPSSPHVASL